MPYLDIPDKRGPRNVQLPDPKQSLVGLSIGRRLGKREILTHSPQIERTGCQRRIRRPGEGVGAKRAVQAVLVIVGNEASGKCIPRHKTAGLGGCFAGRDGFEISWGRGNTDQISDHQLFLKRFPIIKKLG